MPLVFHGPEDGDDHRPPPEIQVHRSRSIMTTKASLPAWLNRIPRMRESVKFDQRCASLHHERPLSTFL